MKKLTTAFVTFLAALLAFTATTLAWFSMRAQVHFPTNFYGSTQAAYFAGGNGSKDEPYTISDPVHLYNLAWLQYLGYFNLKDGFNNGRAQSFFKLEKSFSCNALVLPPIGTAEYPFIGNFDGNGKVLSNVTVSNYKNGDNGFSRYPDKAQFNATTNLLLSSNSSNDSEVSIVGLFGVTGDYNDFVTQKYASVTKKDSEETPAQNTATVTETEFAYGNMQVKDFYVNNLHVNSQSEKTLVGLVAGYVRGSVNNVGVYACDMQLKKGAQGLEENSSTVSHYAIVGNYDDSKVEWEEKPIGGGQGDSAAWGGSIDIRGLSRRLNYMITENAATKAPTFSTTYYDVTNSKYTNLNVRVSYPQNKYNKAYQFDYNKIEQNDKKNTAPYMLCDLKSGTKLPLNVDQSMFNGKDETRTVGSYAWNTNTYYSSYSSEIESSTNTGYLVGGTYGSSGSIRIRMQPLVGTSTIFQSYGKSNAAALETYERNQLRLYTYNTKFTTSTTDSHQFVQIADLYNKDAVLKDQAKDIDVTKPYKDLNTTSTYTTMGSMIKYQDIYEDFPNFLGAKDYIYGLTFQSSLSSNDEFPKTQDGKLVEGAINFKLENDGVITSILGCMNGNAAMFSLYQVSRNETDGKISGLNRVATSYRTSDNMYEINPKTTEGMTCVFSSSWYNSLVYGRAYYVEIPVPAGEYMITKDTVVTASNAYLMYLDIGANGGNDGSGSGSTGATKPYDIASVDFVSAQTDTDFAVPQKDGATYFPQYADVTFSVSSVTEKAVVKYRRAEYAADDLADAQTTPIASVLKYYCENVTLTPAYGSGGKAEEDESLKN